MEQILNANTEVRERCDRLPHPTHAKQPQEPRLTIPPTIAVADGGLGFWAALREAYPTTREQRCSSPQDRQRQQLTLVIQGRIFTNGVLQHAA
jgi:hypothetical protein